MQRQSFDLFDDYAAWLVWPNVRNSEERAQLARDMRAAWAAHKLHLVSDTEECPCEVCDA